MDTDLYTKPVEELIRSRHISLFYHGFVPDGVTEDGHTKEKRSEWWKAYRTGSKQGEGETPRDAIIDLYKKLNKSH